MFSVHGCPGASMAKSIFRAVVVTTLSTAVFGGSVAEAGSFRADYPVEQGDLVVPGDDTSSSPTVQAGSAVTLRGGGFAPGATVTMTIESTPQTLGTTVAGATGAFSATVTIPADISAGQHTLKASGATSTGAVLILSQPVTVTTRPSSELPATGSSIAPVLLIASAALVVGCGSLLAGRRNAKRSAA